MKNFQLATLNPQPVQLQRLRTILSRNQDTLFGKKYKFSNINSVDDYRKSVPIQDYSDFKRYIDTMLRGDDNVLVSEKIEMFGVTSGSTAAPKYIPVTRSFTLEYHNSHLLWMYNMVKSRDDKVVGSIFSMVSPAEDGMTEGGVPFGSSSGKQYRDQSVPIRALHSVPYSAFLIKDSLVKYRVALVFALRSDMRVVNAANPSTLILLANILKEFGDELIDIIEKGSFNNVYNIDGAIRADLNKHIKPLPARAVELRKILKRDGVLTPKVVWPNLCAINTWQGGNAPFYLSKVAPLWGDAPQRCLGLRATEGMFSIPLVDFTSSAVLAITGHFMEFIEDGCEVTKDSETLLAHEIEVGKRYRLIITTSSGLYRYDLGDIVEVTKMYNNTPEISFLHKAGGVLSVTGEKVYEDQIVTVMKSISESVDYEICGFSVTVELAEEVRYVLAVELEVEKDAEALQQLIDLFDNTLAEHNIEYKDKRDSRRLLRPALLVLLKGTYANYRELMIKNGSPDGQIKPPHIIKPTSQGRIEDSGCLFFDSIGAYQRVQ